MSPTVTGTFLFTDLVDSTALTSGLGRDEGDALRTTTFALLREAIDAAGGTEVKNLGDGLMVMFTSTTRALAGAVAMQQAIDRYNRRADTPLSVRIGVSMGDATEEGGDYFGDPVIEASRLCGAAAGGEILTTELVAMIVGRHAEHPLDPVGELELKGLPEPVSAVSVRWEPAATDDHPPLPRQMLSVGNQALFAFFGREQELGMIADARKAAAADRRLRAVLVGGEPGMGKTSLAAQAARAAHAEGGVVAFGGCGEELCPPYGPWIGVLSHLIADAPDGTLDGLLPVHVGGLRRLLPALADRLPPGDAVTADADTERFLLLEAVVALLGAASASAPLVVVLDDVQWADDASLTVVRHLVASAEALPVTIVATYRTSDVGRGAPLQVLLAEAHREPRVQRLDLQGLSDVDIVDLMSAAAGYELDGGGVALAHALHRETDGNAFFVTELLRHLAETGEIAPDDAGRYALVHDIADLALPQSVREVVEHRAARLGDEAIDALAVAAVIGAEFDIDLLRAVVDIDEERLLDLLDAGIQAALLTEGAVAGTYRFADALVQHTMAQSLSATRRQRLHQRIAEVLEAAGAPTAELAHHWIAATRPADSSRARAYAERAGVEALDASAPADAERWYRQALELLDQEPVADERERCRLLIEVAKAQKADGRTIDHAETIAAVGAVALRLGDPELTVAAALTLTAAGDPFGGGDERERRLILAALEVAGPADSTDRARLLAALAEATDSLEWRTRHRLAAEALAVAERTTDREAQIEVVAGTYSMVAVPENLTRRLATLDRALDDLDRTASIHLLNNTLTCRAQATLEDGDLVGYEECLAASTRSVARCGTAENRSVHANMRGVVVLLRGHTDEAERWFTEQFEMLSASRHPAAGPMFGIALVHVRRLQGRLDEVIELFEAAAEDATTMPVFQVTIAKLHAEVGRLDDSRRHFAPFAAQGFAEVVPRDQLWLTAMTHLADTAAMVGDRDAAGPLVDLLAPFEAHMASTGMTFDGRVGGALAPLDVLLGDDLSAERRYAESVEVYRRLDFPFWLSRTLLDRAARLGGPTEEADRAEALEIAERYGFAGLARQAG